MLLQYNINYCRKINSKFGNGPEAHVVFFITDITVIVSYFETEASFFKTELRTQKFIQHKTVYELLK